MSQLERPASSGSPGTLGALTLSGSAAHPHSGHRSAEQRRSYPQQTQRPNRRRRRCRLHLPDSLQLQTAKNRVGIQSGTNTTSGIAAGSKAGNMCTWGVTSRHFIVQPGHRSLSGALNPSTTAPCVAMKAFLVSLQSRCNPNAVTSKVPALAAHPTTDRINSMRRSIVMQNHGNYLPCPGASKPPSGTESAVVLVLSWRKP